MYLAQYTIGESTWVQSALKFKPYPGQDPEYTQWWSLFTFLLRGLDAIGKHSTALRLHLRDGELTAALFVVAPVEHLDQLRRLVAPYTRLETFVEDSIHFVVDASEHDELLKFPSLRCRVMVPAFVRENAWFAFNMRVNPLLTDLFAAADSLGYNLAYHLNVEQLHIQPGWIRAAAKNLLRVGTLAGVPESLYALQRGLSAQLRSATAVCEELLGVESQDAAMWLSSALDQQFHRQYALALDQEFHFGHNEYQDELVATKHRANFEDISAEEVCACSLNDESQISMLSWKPSPTLFDKLGLSVTAPSPHRRPVEVESTPFDYGGMPAPYDGTQPYVFISYKREDLERIKSLIAQVVGQAFRIWYDKGIPGGSEWDTVIEERIQNCALVVAFLSQKAIDSKYVRREVKFADALDKPILCVRLDADIRPAHGLRMLLNQYQVVEGDGRSLTTELTKVLERSG